MMKRFSRRRRNAGQGPPTGTDTGQSLAKILEQKIVEAESLEAWADPEVPESVALIGRGAKADGTSVIVSFSPKSATSALLGGLSAAQFAADKTEFTGQLVVIAPQWSAGARNLLGLLGRTPYSVEPIAAPQLASGRIVVEPEPRAGQLAASPMQLASRIASNEVRAAFIRSAAALEGLAAKHGGAVRVGIDRLELVVLARRVAEIQVDREKAVLETQIGGNSTTPLTGADLASALDGLEGQLRRRLNDRKIRESEEGLRGRVVAELAGGMELRGLRAWPTPGTDVDVIDGVGVNAEGDPVVVAVRQEVEWSTLADVLDALGPVSSLFAVLFADTAPPLRLGEARLLLVAERFADGLERALSALTIAYEMRKVSGVTGAGIDLVASAAGAGAQAKAPRRGRRRGGRGRSNGSESGPSDEAGPPLGPAADLAENAPQIPSGPRSESAGEDEQAGSEDAGRGRGRSRRRSRRGRGGNADGPAAEASPRKDGDREEGRSSEGGRAPRPRFEEVSLMDLDDGPGSAGGSGSAQEDSGNGNSTGNGDRPRRGQRRGRRGGRGEARRGGEGRSEGRGESGDGSPAAESSDDAPASGSSKDPDVVTEEDLVEADDLSEILARLTEDEPDFDDGTPEEESFEDEEDIDEDAVQSARRRERETRLRSKKDAPEEGTRSVARGRAAILVHGDRDSLLSAILLARDIRQLEGLWVYPQEELMTFFRSIATDLRDDTPIFVVGFNPSPARDVIQASALYRGRLTWFGRQAWPPEDLVGLRESLGADAIHGGEGIDSLLPLVLETCSRRSRFSDKLVDLATGRFTQHDFERWGRLWRWRAGEIAAKTGDIRADVAALLAGRPSDLAKEAALVELPPPPVEVDWVSGNDFRLIHFGGHIMVVLEVEAGLDPHLAARIARERYSASLSLAHSMGDETFIFGGEEVAGKRTLDHMAMAEHLVNKLEWVDGRPDADHVARFRVRDLDRHPERLEEIIGEIAMGRSLLER